MKSLIALAGSHFNIDKWKRICTSHDQSLERAKHKVTRNFLLSVWEALLNDKSLSMALNVDSAGQNNLHAKS